MKISRILLIVMLTACAGTADPTMTQAEPATSSTSLPAPVAAATTTATTLPPDVSAFLEEAYTVMFENAVRRNAIDWEQFRSRYDAAIASVAPTSITEAHRVIRRSLLWLLDQHSTFLSPDEVAAWTEPSSRAVDFEPSLIDGRFGYLSVPWFSTSSETAINNYATELQAAMADLSARGACAWIIDLRTNLGGTMWPMVAGLGPLLGEGEIGANIRPDGSTIPWVYREGEAWWGDELLARTLQSPFTFPTGPPPTAVLIGGRTASAGEAIAIAFAGRADTRSFGQPTAGLTSAPEPYPLSDGSILFLADSYMGDRLGNSYPSRVEPDTEVLATESLDAAIQWLEAQGDCG